MRQEDADPGRRALSFRHALAIAGGLVLGALVMMVLLSALALAEADRLIDRLALSQDQLARVTRIEADMNAALLTAYESADRAALTERLDAVAAQADAYLATIRAEQAAAGGPASHEGEAGRGEALAGAVRALRTELAAAPLPAAPDDPSLAGARLRLQTLAAEVEAGERAEADAAIEMMRRMRARTAIAGLGVFALALALSGAGAWAMLRAMARPLQTLEQAAGRIGAEQAAPPPAAPLRGFAEIRAVARAFNRLGAEVHEQRGALARHNRELESQVRERTQEIEAGRARLEEIDRTRRQLFSKIGHELRTPATVIRGEAEVALRDAARPAPALREALEHVAANSAFLQRRLDDLLALARAEDGSISLAREPVRLDGLLERVAALAEPYTRSSGVTLRRTGEDGAGMVVTGDESWLSQALLAVIDNAAKFAAGAQAVTLSLRREGGTAVIGVADSGPGVAPEVLPHLFESFYQAPGGAAAGGAGIGLAVTGWVAEQHGGSVAARNEEGGGLTIELSLPLAS